MCTSVSERAADSAEVDLLPAVRIQTLLDNGSGGALDFLPLMYQ